MLRRLMISGLVLIIAVSCIVYHAPCVSSAGFIGHLTEECNDGGKIFKERN